MSVSAPAVSTVAAEVPPPSLMEIGVFSVLTAGLRLLPTLGLAPFNFAPVGGFAVFAGAKMRGWLAYVLPVFVMIAADLVLAESKGETYAPWNLSQPVVYFCFIGYALLGRLFQKQGLVGMGAAAVLGSVQFYLITNFAAWIELSQQGFYPMTFDGLMLSYELGLPFYRNTFISDMIFPFAFLALHWLWQRHVESALTPASTKP